MIVRTARFAAVRIAVLCALLAAAVRPAGAADAVLYRVFLLDGTTIVSYGDFVRVGDRVVVSIPIGAVDSEAPKLQLVSIPESRVDWARTEEYAYAARAKRYAEARGEADFSRLSNEVAEALNEVAHTSDPARRLALAERARKVLGEWPAHNYGYRARDVAQLTAMLDEVVSELRVAAGQSRFDVSLVSNVEARVPVPVLPPPSERETIEGALEAARLAAEPAQRVSLLSAVAQALQPLAAESWASALYARARKELAAEERIDEAYADLSTRMLTAAERHAKSADVRGIERLIKRTLQTDDALGRRRPQATAALLATLDARLDAARRLRLARDAWAVRLGLVRAYEQRIEPTVAAFRQSTQWLEDIRQLAGPSPSALKQLVRRIESASRTLARIKPPAELESAHGMLTAAVQMAGRAAASRQTAIRGATSMQRAWEASSAAAGALMLFEKALEELRRLVAPPEL